MLGAKVHPQPVHLLDWLSNCLTDKPTLPCATELDRCGAFWLLLNVFQRLANSSSRIFLLLLQLFLSKKNSKPNIRCFSRSFFRCSFQCSGCRAGNKTFFIFRVISKLLFGLIAKLVFMYFRVEARLALLPKLGCRHNWQPLPTWLSSQISDDSWNWQTATVGLPWRHGDQFWEKDPSLVIIGNSYGTSVEEHGPV